MATGVPLTFKVSRYIKLMIAAGSKFAHPTSAAKSRTGCGSSSGTIDVKVSAVFVPLRVRENVTELTSIKASAALEKQCPDCISEALYNFCLKLIAVDTRNGMTTRALLNFTELRDVPIQAHELSRSL